MTAAWAMRNTSAVMVTQGAGGTVPVPEFAVSPESLDFGDVTTGTAAQREVTVTNEGTAGFAISEVAVDGADANQYAVVGGTCATVVAAGESCTVVVAFTPTSEAATAAELTFTADTATTPVALSGTGTATPVPPGPAPGPAPRPDDRTPQKPANAKGLPPKKIQTEGTTVLTGRNARTSAGQLIRTRVRVTPLTASSQGEVRYYRIIRGPQGKVSIRTFGYPLKIVVIQSAPPTKTARAYLKRTVYLDGVKQ